MTNQSAPPNSWRDLRQQMQDLFDLEELRALTFDLEVDYEDLGEGIGKSERIIKLIEFMVGNGRLADLLAGLQQARPSFDWPTEADLPTPSGHSLFDGPTIAQLYNVLPLSPNYLPRPQELNGLKTAVLNPDSATGRSRIIGLQGMGGIGKSVLAAAVAWDDDVRGHFPDGIFWVSLGQTPALETRQKQLVDGLHPGAPTFRDVQEGRAQLSRTLADKQCLIIVDDVWELGHATAFDVLAQSQSRLLITSRNLDILQSLGADIHRVQLLDDHAAITLLAQAADVDPLSVVGDAEARQVAKECGHLPLALAMVGAMVRGNAQPWNRALRRLERADLSRIKENFPHYPYPDLLRAIQVSVEALNDEDLKSLDPIDRYIDLAVFAEDKPIPMPVLERLWEPAGLDDIDTEDLVTAFVGRSLVLQDEAGHLRLHDLNVNYTRQQAGDLTERHTQLLDAYEVVTEDGTWPTGPNDGYYFQQLAYHLIGAGRTDELVDLLFDIEWLMAKLKATDVNELLGDYEVALQAKAAYPEDLRLVQDTIRLSAHVLAQDNHQLASQLLGRLQAANGEMLDNLLESVKAWHGAVWLRPLTASLSPPGGPLLRTLIGHEKEVLAAVLTPDLQRIVSAAKDKTIKVWDLASGMELLTLEGHNRTVNGLAVTPDGRRLLSASADKTIKVWDLASGTELATWEGHSRIVNNVTITPDGRRALSVSNDRTVKVWDMNTGKELASMEGHRDSIKDVVVTPDGRFAVSAADDRRLRIWDLTEYQSVTVLEGHTSWVNAVAITADGTRIISASDDNTVKVWDLATHQELATLSGHSTSVKAIATTPDSKYAFSGSAKGNIKLWDLAHFEEVTSLPAHPAGVNDVVVSADGRYIVTASDDHTMRIGDVERAKEYVNLAEHLGSVNGIAITPDGQFALTASEECVIKVWRLANQAKVVLLEGHDVSVQAVVLTADGQHALSVDNGGTRRLWDLETYTAVKTYPRQTMTVAVAPDALAVTPDGQRALTASGSMVSVWDIESGEELLALKWHGSTVNSVEVTPDGTKAITGSNDRKLKVWDLETGAEIMALEGHTSRVNGVEITDDGKHILSASDDHTIKVWDVATGKELRTFSGHGDAVHGLAIMPDQKRAVSLGGGLVLVWEIDTGKIVASFYADEGVACAVSEDGTIVVGSINGRVHFLRLE